MGIRSTRPPTSVWRLRNERMAELVGMLQEELLALFTDHDLELQLLEADWLACFLLDLEFSKKTHTQVYLRLAAPPRRCRR